MNKKTIQSIGAAVIVIVVGFIVITSSKNKETTHTDKPTVALETAVTDKIMGFTTGRVDRVESGKIYATILGRNRTINTDRNTQIVKQVNEKGVFKDVPINLTDIKTGNMIEVTFAKTDLAQTVRVLQ
jgi:hypothetical protein